MQTLLADTRNTSLSAISEAGARQKKTETQHTAASQKCEIGYIYRKFNMSTFKGTNSKPNISWLL